MKAIHRLAHAKEPAAKIRRDKEPVECRACGETAMREEWRDNLYICPHCGNHRGMTAASRIRITADSGSFREFGRSIRGGNPLGFPGYTEKIQEMRDKTNLNDAVVTGTAKVHGRRTVLVVMDNRFMMGSMGMAVGEKVTRAFEYATKKKLPVIVFSTSGGARMQEGMMSLLQMAKTSAAVAKHDEAGLLYVSVMTHPTTGGVTASFAMLGDIQLAEPDALIGFAGPRVIEQTIGEKLPKGFQRAQFQYDHGFLDRIVDRREMRDTLGRILELHA
ncbi:MAG: acetyl-CoA carboxylase, carboxyltransferase subunit beta [Mogibacterium kristiansenii]|nr:acetyl-CoA carboxylase, carboxyltransferase subunit beta [Mogibacterium kristiansenii]MDD6700361.1 acetyl-CoA carboxylase, carboxyltransferase subunit beta [Mogibacterium kristiansenii]